MQDERSYNQPTFDKDKEYTECEDCCGTGTQYECDEQGNQCIPIPCGRCRGEGILEITND